MNLLIKEREVIFVDKFINLWEPVLKSFSRSYPHYYEEMVDWFPSGHLEITVKLRDGRLLTYELMDDRIRFITDDYDDGYFDESVWRNNFSECLIAKMRKRGVSRDRLSELTGISRVTISKYTNGKASPSGYNLELMARALCCSISELTSIR